MSLTGNEILNGRPRRVVKVHVPEWGAGAEVFVRVLGGNEIGPIADAISDIAKAERSSAVIGVYVDTCLICLSDEHGARLFGDEQKAAVSQLEFTALKRCADAALALNGLTTAGAEELEGN